MEIESWKKEHFEFVEMASETIKEKDAEIERLKFNVEQLEIQAEYPKGMRHNVESGIDWAIEIFVTMGTDIDELNYLKEHYLGQYPEDEEGYTADLTALRQENERLKGLQSVLDEDGNDYRGSEAFGCDVKCATLKAVDEYRKNEPTNFTQYYLLPELRKVGATVVSEAFVTKKNQLEKELTDLRALQVQKREELLQIQENLREERNAYRQKLEELK